MMQVSVQDNEVFGGERVAGLPASRAVREAVAGVAAGGIPQIWLGTFLATIFALRVIGRFDHSLLLWPVSGVALALALPHWQVGWKKRARLLVATAAGFWTAASVIGMPWKIAAMIAGLTCLDIFIGAWILGPGMSGPGVNKFDGLKEQRNIFKLLTAVVVAPVVTGPLGAYAVAGLLHQPVLQTALMNILGNSVGMAIFVPAVLMLKTGEWLGLGKRAAHKGRVAGATALFVGVSVFVFWQTTNPFLFMVFPAMILMILMMGLEGSVLASAIVTCVGCIATMHGHGPIMLVHGTALHHLLVLQGFVWMCAATALPVGALLDERRRAEHSVRESQSIYKVLMQNVEDLIVLSSMDGAQRYVSPAITRLAGWTPQEYVKFDRLEMVHPDDVVQAQIALNELIAGSQEETVRYRLREKSGAWKWVQATMRAYGIEGEKIAGYVGTVRDISDLREIEENWKRERRGLVQESKKMATLANTDPLTGLLNRRGFDERVQTLEHSVGVPHTLLMIDLDYFKRYNDTYGHLAGDNCLVQLAGVLRSHATRSGDIVARLGGEEFAVILSGASLEEATTVAETMCGSLRNRAMEHEKSPFGVVTMSVGVALQDMSAELDINALLANADSALYASKGRRNCVSGYHASAVGA